MTDPTAASSDDPNWLVAQLREDIATTEDEPDLPKAPTSDEMWAETVVGGASIEYPAVLEAAADALIAPKPVSPAARKRFIAAAERALAARRSDLGPLPVVLAAARKRAELTIEQVQSKFNEAGIEASASELETGRVRIHDAGQKVTAIWIHAVRLDRTRAREATARSLDADLGGELRPAAGNQTIRKETEAWLTILDSELDQMEEEAK